MANHRIKAVRAYKKVSALCFGQPRSGRSNAWKGCFSDRTSDRLADLQRLLNIRQIRSCGSHQDGYGCQDYWTNNAPLRQPHSKVCLCRPHHSQRSCRYDICHVARGWYGHRAGFRGLIRRPQRGTRVSRGGWICVVSLGRLGNMDSEQCSPLKSHSLFEGMQAPDKIVVLPLRQHCQSDCISNKICLMARLNDGHQCHRENHVNRRRERMIAAPLLA